MNTLLNSLSNIPFLILCLYIAALFGISFYTKKRSSQGSTAFLLAGRQLTTPLVAVSVAGLAIGAASTVGVAESSYNVGLAAGWYNGAWAAGALVMGLIGAAKYRELGVSTLPELFERVFGKYSRLMSAIALLIVMMMITALQYMAGGAILSTMLPDVFDFRSGMLISAVVFIGIALIGGLWSSGLSNLLSVALIYFGIILVTVVTVMKAGGISQIQSQLPPSDHWFSLKGTIPLSVLVGWFVVMITQTLTAQGPVQIACSAKDGKAAKRGYLWGALIIFPIGFLCALLGIAARAQFPGILPTLALPQIILSLDPVLAGIVLSALWAADVSTACTILMGASTLFTQDIFKRFISPESDDQKLLKISRFSVVIVGLITLWLAFNAKEIVQTMMIGLSLTTAFTLVFLLVIFRPQWCRMSTAFWTTLVGVAGLALWQFVPAIRVFSHVIYFEWLICVATAILVYFIDPRKISLAKLTPVTTTNKSSSQP